MPDVISEINELLSNSNKIIIVPVLSPTFYIVVKETNAQYFNIVQFHY